MKLIVASVSVWLIAACSATCLRDSDCQGDSVCVRDRCVLVVRTDASPVPAPRPPAPSAGTGGTGGSAGGGASAGASGAAGTATDPREILDAASDAERSAD